VVLIRTPYGKDGLSETCTALAFLGYACVAQDARGRFASGDRTRCSATTADGEQRWSGIVRQHCAMAGSAPLAARRWGSRSMRWRGSSRATVCQVPVVATPDFYHHAAFQGGVLREELVHNWLEARARWTSTTYSECTACGCMVDDAAVLPHVAMSARGLHIGGWYDIFLQGTLDAYDAFQHAVATAQPATSTW